MRVRRGPSVPGPVQLGSASSSADLAVTIEPATITGQLDPSIVQRYVARSSQRLQACYAQAQRLQPLIAGTVVTTFTITGAKGLVTKPTAAGVDAGLARCFATVLAAIQFPLPRDKQNVTVEQRLTIDGKPTPPARSKHEGTGTGTGTGTAQAPTEGRMGNGSSGTYDFRTGELTGGAPALDIPERYFPGESSPLRALEHELVACFRTQRAPWGVAVFDVGPRTLAAHGIDDPAFGACVARLGAGLDPPRPVRCSVAFGTQPIDTALGIDITTANILFGAQITRDRAEVVQRAAERAAMRASTTAPVLLDGPLVVRPLPDAPMQLVNEVIMGLVESREDHVLAARRADRWELFESTPVALPVVPIPRGTGVRWSAPRGLPATDAHERAVVSILVTTDAVLIGDTTGTVRKIEGFDADAIAAVLFELKASHLFEDRDDLEIAADDEVAYDTVVRAIDLALQRGFRRWSLHTPSTTSVPFRL